MPQLKGYSSISPKAHLKEVTTHGLVRTVNFFLKNILLSLLQYIVVSIGNVRVSHATSCRRRFNILFNGVWLFFWSKFALALLFCLFLTFLLAIVFFPFCVCVRVRAYAAISALEHCLNETLPRGPRPEPETRFLSGRSERRCWPVGALRSFAILFYCSRFSGSFHE